MGMKLNKYRYCKKKKKKSYFRKLKILFPILFSFHSGNNFPDLINEN